MCPLSLFLFLFLFGLFTEFGDVLANITTTQFLRDNDTLISNSTLFKLGFFSPTNSTTRYLGIWYNTTDSDMLEVIWVANRDNPLNDSSGVLRISSNGNLQVSNGQNQILWSSNVSYADANNTVAQLTDSGNLVLLSNVSGATIWQSFEHPTDSLLPLMELNARRNTNNRRKVRSWKSPSDPSSGRFSAGIAPRMPPEVFVWDGDRPYWRSGPWNGHVFIGLPSFFYSAMLDGFRITKRTDDTLVIAFTDGDPSKLNHYVVTYNGIATRREWDNHNRKWQTPWSSIESECDYYGKCGPFGICNSQNYPICSCLEGFEPTNSEEWNEGHWTSGCVRRKPLQCGTTGGKEDGFLRLQNIKVPDNADWLFTNDEEDCMKQCLENCSCLAYAYYLGIGCMTWYGSLIDLQKYNVTAVDVFIRLAHSELGKPINWRIILVVVLIIGAATFAIVSYCLWRWKCGQRGNRSMGTNKLLHDNKLAPCVSELQINELPVFKFEELAAATGDFSHTSKLGQGGFGPVYKGKLEDGQEIAVKRLSRASGQGLQEFMNEVLLISKLQHRNLVRLLGCCVEGEEKMLIYEYMPNKSLDALLFDPVHRSLLDWKKRLNIIEGICRGLLYLHRDSRLRIIHRDLKASNILLDEDLSPKISDFGMAKIFGRKDDQGNTSRIVGTFGYMSPEYAMEGRFSEKSDVYSFGVLLLEIVSGRRNSSFKDHDSLSLVGYVWKLWNEDDILSVINPAIFNPCFQGEILKSIKLGLLCVQDHPEDRPNVSEVISMLESDISDLPHPMQPGFIQRRISSCDKVPPNGELSSVNKLSVTYLSAR